MKIKREERHYVDFPVFLTIQTGNVARRINGRCIGLSGSGATMETLDRLKKGAVVLVQSPDFGRMGLASVQYCTRLSMKYTIGLNFGTGLRLSDPGRREMLEKVLSKSASPKPESGTQGPVLPQ